MPKICDPPPFLGGQCIVSYTLIFRATIVIFENQPQNIGRVDYRQARGRGSQVSGFLGAIKSVGECFVATPTWNFPCTDKNGSFVATTDFTTPTSTTFNARYSKPIFHSLSRIDGKADNCGNLPNTNCRCSDNSCRVDCTSEPDGFCCIEHSFSNSLLSIVSN